MGKLSGRKLSCKYLTEKAPSFEFLRNSDKVKWQESEKKEENRKSAQRGNRCFMTWDIAWIHFE